MAVIFAAVLTVGAGPSPAATDVADLGDHDRFRAAFTKTCLADESCTRELFLDMTLGSRFDPKGYHADHVFKWSCVTSVVGPNVDAQLYER